MCMLSFDFAKEEFHSLPLPDDLDDRYVDLHDFNGLLAAVVFPMGETNPALDVWVWNDGSWIKKFTTEPLPVPVEASFGFSRVGKHIFLEGTDHQLLLYDRVTKVLREIYLDHDYDCSSSLLLIPYVQSWFQLNPPEILDKKTKRIQSRNLLNSGPSGKEQVLAFCTIKDSVYISRKEVFSTIKHSFHNCLSETNLQLTGLKSKTSGKVRDIYDCGDYIVLVTTDRKSAFDRILASIPFKGQVLNEMSFWWFNRTQHITSNAVVSVPDKNVTIAKKCFVFPVEFVVRGFMTGSTDTSLWTVYKNGVRNYCGNVLPNGLVKNQKLMANILTPTTKAEDHDVLVTPYQIIERGLMTRADFNEAREKALSLFEYGQRVALEHGLILVDTKYEFGKGSDGSILLINEVHTPDSSTYWIAYSYQQCFQNGLEPENINIDKEFLRLWFEENCNPYEDKVLTDSPEELVCELAWRYIFLYEAITKSRFEMRLTKEPIHDLISRNVFSALLSLRN